MSRRSLATLTASALTAALAVTLAPATTTAYAAPPVVGAAPQAAATQLAAVAPQVTTQAAVPAASAARTRGRVSYSPRTFVGGQELTFGGNIGAPGRRKIVLQQNMTKQPNGWFAVPGFSGMTGVRGGFRFQAPAPGMFNVRYRVAAPGFGVTPAMNMIAKTQDSLISVPRTITPGQPFQVTVDTSPDLPGRSDVRGTPIFPGRGLTLQKRVNGSTWETIGSGTVGSNGTATFTRTESAGTHVYRVRQEPVRSGHTQLGWTPSFPTYISVGGGARTSSSPTPAAAEGWDDWDASGSSTRVAPGAQFNGGGQGRTSSGTYKWGAMLWDFAWERGEGLGDLPYRGTERRGSWSDYTDGTGRVYKHNGGLSIDSSRNIDGARADRGTTMATMRGNARAYGRWETRLRVLSGESHQADYKIRAELVPDDPADYACGRSNILIAEFRAHGSTVGIGAKNGSTQWTAGRTVGRVLGKAPAVAVEVQRTHITWFWEGRAIGTLGAGAVSGKPMTLRLSLVGQPGTEMDKTQLISDWQRGFKPEPGRQVRAGGGLNASSISGSC